MEYLEHHLGEVIQLLKERLGMTTSSSSGSSSGQRQTQTQHHSSSRAYLLFDLPGQIELTAHSNVISRIAQRLIKELDLRLVCVQLVDAAVCLTDVSKFIGAALVCTASMMRLGECVMWLFGLVRFVVLLLLLFVARSLPERHHVWSVRYIPFFVLNVCVAPVVLLSCPLR